LPQKALTAFAGWVATRQWGGYTTRLIAWFVGRYNVNMAEAAEPDIAAYPSFNAFFTRALRPEARPLATATDAVVSPVDGRVSEAGRIKADRILQAKGHDYTLQALLAGAAADWAPRFAEGEFATIYLAPTDYHRIHMPCSGTLREAWFVPGDLFSVNATTARLLPGLFARNERVVLLFEGDAGAFAVVLVGALFVGSMSTVWHGDVAPAAARLPQKLPLEAAQAALQAQRGAELGRFNMGSTVILLHAPSAIRWHEHLVAGQVLRMGEAIGTTTPGLLG
jgi:phosphatidylserine decarboxylase